MVIELTKITQKRLKTIEDLKQNTEKPRRDMDGQMDCIWVNLKNVGPPFFRFISVYTKMSFTQLENHSQLSCGRAFANKRLFALPI